MDILCECLALAAEYGLQRFANIPRSSIVNNVAQAAAADEEQAEQQLAAVPSGELAKIVVRMTTMRGQKYRKLPY